MKQSLIFPAVGAFIVLLMSAISTGQQLSSDDLTSSDYEALKICEGVIQLFEQFPDSIWPGYNLASQPFLTYMPERWALLFNYPDSVDGFKPYPPDWPSLGTSVQIHHGQYRDLIGQLGFNTAIGSDQVVAVGFQDRSVLEHFGYIVHEAFHQYQFAAFGEIPWKREELYPIENAENTALAVLEMDILMDALKAAQANKNSQCRELVGQFLAVRNYRWANGDPYIARYEQAQELNEGTAKYVETRCVGLTSKMSYKSSLDNLTGSLHDDLKSLTAINYILDNFTERITNNSLSPEAVARYRVYPVGAALGLLLDYFGIDWKAQAQLAGDGFTFAGLLEKPVKFKTDQIQDLIKKAKAEYDYDKILESTQQLIKDYRDSYAEASKSFESQSGYRVEVRFMARNISRSRSSRGRKWLIDNGAWELSSHLNVYDTKNKNLKLQYENGSLLEYNNWQTRERAVIVFVPQIDSLYLDNSFMPINDNMPGQFTELRMTGSNFDVEIAKPGTINKTDNGLTIDVTQ